MIKFFPILLVLLVVSCEVTPDPLSWQERKVADSIYSERKIVLEKELDSICAVQYDSIYEHLYKELYQAQLKSIERLKKEE